LLRIVKGLDGFEVLPVVEFLAIALAVAFSAMVRPSLGILELALVAATTCSNPFFFLVFLGLGDCHFRFPYSMSESLLKLDNESMMSSSSSVDESSPFLTSFH
jgi:hypothetical protein